MSLTGFKHLAADVEEETSDVLVVDGCNRKYKKLIERQRHCMQNVFIIFKKNKLQNIFLHLRPFPTFNVVIVM